MKKIAINLAAILLILCGCKASIVTHDENKAAASAEQFANIAFVQHDFVKAYNLIYQEDRKSIPFEKFEKMLGEMHPAAFPLSITATEYEMIPGQRAMDIFLTGKNSDDAFIYRIRMVGTAPSGYFVAGAWRLLEPPQTSSLRKHLRKL